MSDKAEQKIRQHRCGLLRRLAAIAYDTFIVTGLLLIAAAVASPFGRGDQQAFRDPLFTLYLMAVWFLYMTICWRYGGMTVGMRAWRIRILPDLGRELSWKICISRFLSSLVSAAILGIGLIWPVFDREKRCWHDMFSHSGLYLVPRT